MAKTPAPLRRNQKMPLFVTVKGRFNSPKIHLAHRVPENFLLAAKPGDTTWAPLCMDKPVRGRVLRDDRPGISGPMVKFDLQECHARVTCLLCKRALKPVLFWKP